LILDFGLPIFDFSFLSTPTYLLLLEKFTDVFYTAFFLLIVVKISKRKQITNIKSAI